MVSKSETDIDRAGEKAAQDALAAVRQQRVKAAAEYDAAAKAVKASQATAAKDKDSKKAVDAQRKLAAEAKVRRDKVAAEEKRRHGHTCQANKKLDTAKASRDQAFQDLLWALMNTKEFVFNH